MANGYSSESTQRELSNEYQHDRIWMTFIIFCFFVRWMNVLNLSSRKVIHPSIVANQICVGVGACGLIRTAIYDTHKGKA